MIIAVLTAGETVFEANGSFNKWEKVLESRNMLTAAICESRT